MAQKLKFGNGTWATKKGSTLAYNDENNNYKPLPFTFTRASNATVVNKAGLIETVGNGIPRIDYKDDSEGAFLLEPSRTNNFTDGNNVAETLGVGNANIIQNNNTSPTGTLSAAKFTENTLLSSHFARLGASITGQVAISIFAKADGRNRIYLTQDFNNGVIFNVNTGVVDSYKGSGFTGSIEDYGNGWYRCIVYTTIASVGTFYLATLLDGSDSTSYTGDGTSSVLLYGSQLEQGSYATSYIPTQGSAVTRLADARTDSALPSTIVSQTEGTIFFKINKSESTGVANRELIVLETPNRASGGLIRVLTTLSKSVMRVLFQINGGIPFDVNIPSQYTPLNTDLKFAIAFKSGDSAVYINGVSTNTSTSTFTIPEQFDNFYLNFSEVKAKFSEIKLYNTRLSNSELQALTS